MFLVNVAAIPKLLLLYGLMIEDAGFFLLHGKLNVSTIVSTPNAMC